MGNEEVSTFTPDPLKVLGIGRATGLPEQAAAQAAEASTRAGRVLTLLDSDLRRLTRVFEVNIVDARQAGPNTVEIVYRYPGYDGLLGLRRDVSVQPVDLDPSDKHYALAVNENSVREMATMLRIELEEPQRPELLALGEDGIRWWGEPAAK